MNKIRAGIIGCGGIANGKHLSDEGTRQCRYARILRYHFRARGKSREEYGAEGAKVFKDYKDLLKLNLDAVYICTPNRSHSDITVDALQSSKHVMCEKPMAINAQEALRMLKAAEETGKILTIGYQNRFRPDSTYLNAHVKMATLAKSM